MTRATHRSQKSIAVVASVLLCSSVLIAATAYAQTTATPESMTAPCSLVVMSGEKRLVYSIVYSVRITGDAPRLRCLGVKSPAQMKDGKVACVVYTCDSAGEHCQQVTHAVNISDMRKNGEIYQKSTQGQETEDGISRRLEQGVPGTCKYQVIPKFPSNLRPQFNQTLPSIGWNGEVTGSGGLSSLYGYDALSDAFSGSTDSAGSPGTQLPAGTAPASLDGMQEPSVPAPRSASARTFARDGISSDIAILTSDPNTVIVEAPVEYSPQKVQNQNTFASESARPVSPMQNRTFMQNAGSISILAGLSMTSVGVLFGNPGIVLGGIGFLYLGTYMGGL